jgi:ABC-2 type transport system ATP-binding protein
MTMINEPVVELNDIRMSFGAKDALKGINLKIYRGQIVGYIGPNGAGKSTTVKILLGLVEGYSGKIKIFGEEINNSSVQYKRRIGYVPETVEIYDNLTAYEYISFIGEIYGMELKEINKKAIRLMNLLGIDQVYHTRISSYSKGMKQKLLIIISLIHNPDILFLDEPLSGLDANSVMIVKEIMAELALQGKTIFYSSHIMDVVEKISNRIVLINDGMIIADGSFEELKEKSKEGSLEQIFNELTGFTRHKEIAHEFINTLQGV